MSIDGAVAIIIAATTLVAALCFGMRQSRCVSITLGDWLTIQRDVPDGVENT